MKSFAMSALLSVLFLSVGCAHHAKSDCGGGGDEKTAQQCDMKNKDGTPKKGCCCDGKQCDLKKKPST